uniref:Uncharacterized protein n=1 Tax=Salix viminalis TaxID=40686 RepID=A0A6N2N5W7_SALVM
MQHGRLGGGFSNYGRTGPPSGHMRDRDDTDGSWGGGGGRRQFGGGFNDERRGPPPSRVSDYDQPSRADEADNWATAKKPLPSFDSGRQSRYDSLGGGGGDGGGSRADEVDNWAVGKKPLPVRSSAFGSGFRDSGPDPDRRDRGGYREPERERPRLVLDPPRAEVVVNEPVRTNKPNPFGAAIPREDVLAGKGLDWKKLEMEWEAKKTSSLQSSRPTSAHSSRPSSAHSNRSEGPGLLQQGSENLAVKPRPRVNPFGEAKPRELLLQERGQDWMKIDRELEHRGVDSDHGPFEVVLASEEALPAVYGHIQQSAAAYSCYLHSEAVYKHSKEIEHSQSELQEGQAKMNENLKDGMPMLHDSWRYIVFKDANFNSADGIENMAGKSLDKQKQLLDGQSNALKGLQLLTQFQSEALEESRSMLQHFAEYGHKQQEELLQKQEQLQKVHDHLVENSILAAQEAFESKQVWRSYLQNAMPETEEEKLLKEQIEHLKTEHEKELTTKVNQESQQVSVDKLPSLMEIINEKERELEILVHDLDDKVRFGPKVIERPGSGAGRSSGFSERPPSRPGSFDESRSTEFMDRPRSRGKPDIWTRPADERRSFQGGRERGFLGSRDFDSGGGIASFSLVLILFVPMDDSLPR